MRRTVAMILVLSVIIMTPQKTVAAATDEQYGWAESVERAQKVYQEWKSTSKMLVSGDSSWDWQQIGTTTVETAKMFHTLTNYERWSQTQDVRWGKVEGVREAKPNNSTYGYVRIRFEGITGEVISETDSGRVWGYGYSEATTPNPNGGGILHAYCGD